MSTFDPQAFLDSTTTETNDTSLPPCPIGEWPASITDVAFKTGTIQKGDRTGEAWHRLDAKWEIVATDANVIAEREKIVVTQGVMLDITAGGGLDMGKGKNVNLGRLREAVGLNALGQPFSLRMLIGRSAKISVAHRTYEGRLLDEVKGAIPL
mgnify:CR=1 FL=1